MSLKPIGDEWVEAATDNGGNYSLQIPADAVRPAEVIRSWTIWSYAEGRQIAAASIYLQITRASQRSVDLALNPASDTGFIVTSPEGLPVQNARVEPVHFRAGNYDIIPEPLRKIIGTTTDEDGKAVLSAVGREGFFTVQVAADGYGTQRLRLKDLASEPAVRTITLRPTGRLEGRLISDNRETKTDLQHVAGGLVNVTYGSFRQSERVRTDADGRFEVDVLPGPVRQLLMIPPENFAGWTEDRDVRGLPIDVLRNADHFDLPPLQLVEKFKRTGRLLNADNQPVAAATIMAVSENRNYGGTTTDAQGNFVLRLPESTQIERYEVTVERGKPSTDAAVITESPLVLQLPGDI